MKTATVWTSLHVLRAVSIRRHLRMGLTCDYDLTPFTVIGEIGSEF